MLPLQVIVAIKAAISTRKIVRGDRLEFTQESISAIKPFSSRGPGRGEVVVDTLYSALNTGTDRATLHCFPGRDVKFPFYPGISGVGKILRKGPDVTTVSVGDVVAGELALASRQRVSARKVARVSPDIDLEDASMLHLCIVAMQGLRLGCVEPDQRIVVFGQGIIGRLATLLARALGSQVTCITQSSIKISKIKEEQWIPLEHLKERKTLEDLQADVVIDATGNPDVIHDALAVARPRGRIVLLGSNRGPTRRFDFNGIPLEKELRIIGANIRNLGNMSEKGELAYQNEAEFVLNMIRNNQVSPKTAITMRLSRDSLPEYYNNRLLSDRENCGIVVRWTDMSY